MIKAYEKEMVNFDKEKLERLKKYYEASDKDVFTFEGKEYLKDYAKYLIQYLETRLK